MSSYNIDSAIRKIKDFPKPGILFYDITSVLFNPDAFKYCIDKMSEMYGSINIDAVAAINNAIVSPIQADSLFMELTLKFLAPHHLEPVVQMLKSYPGSHVLIEVYTENSGSADFNLLLSQQQAKLIRDYLKFDQVMTDYQYSAVGLGNYQFFNPHLKLITDGGIAAIIIYKE